MAKAEQMFKELNYQLIEETKDKLVYRNDNYYIVFDNIHKIVHHYRLANLPGDYKKSLTIGLFYEELKAINQQTKELGWIE